MAPSPFWLRSLVALAALLAVGGVPACAPSGGAPAPSAQDPAQYRQLLGDLTVAAEGSMRGYSRDRFPHWRKTGGNCDVRDTVLRRDGEAVKTRGCNVVGGRWLSRYDGRTVTDPSEVDIDHMVPLANAWRSGASRWTDARREDFANDLDRPQLLASSRSSNRAKGDQNPAQWKPPDRGYWCRYAEDWITVKHYWKLTVTSAERTALLKMLETC